MVFPSGSYYCYHDKCGYYFWGIHSHDSIWHLALINAAFSKFSIIVPTFAGATLTGYNYLYDLLLFFLSKLGISPLFSFFKLIPTAWFTVYTILLILLAKKIKNNSIFIGILLFFTFFTGSFSYFFTIIKDRTISGSYGYLSQLPMHIMLNVQFGLSLLGILYILIKIKEKKLSRKEIIIFGIITFINLGLKFYGGVITYILVIAYSIFNIKKNTIKKSIINILITSIFFTASLIIFYNPLVSVKSGSIFTLVPFALIHPITEDPSLFYLQKLTDARYFLLTKGIGLKLIAIEAFNLIIFLFFYLGVRFFGLIFLLYKLIRRKVSIMDVCVVATMIAATTLSVLLVQKAEWWNTIQFFYYAIFLSTIYIAEFSYELIRKFKLFGWIAVLIFMFLAIPSTLTIAQWSFHFPGNTYLPYGEYEALQVLKNQPIGVVYSPLFDKSLNGKYIDPKPLFASGDNSYVTAFSGKPSYIVDVLQLRLIGGDYEKRLEKVKNNDCSILKDIDYIYFNNEYKVSRSLFDCPSKLEMLYGNLTATIYKVRK